MTPTKNSFRQDGINLFRGILMGAADVVPGVSGGTVALILGHYSRLVDAITHFDRSLLKLVFDRKWKAALEYIDFRFLLLLGLGIAIGIIGLASTMHYLLEHQQAYIYAVFFGLIIASSIIITRQMKGWTPLRIGLAAVAAIFAWQIGVLKPIDGNLTPVNVFLSAMVAICAMILPGISGAFVLLLLGMYHPITGLIKKIPKGDIALGDLVTVAIFLAGCAVGLMLFTRVLRWLLAHRHDSTMAALVGLMMGSLYRIWPFQVATEETAGLEFKERFYIHIWPSESPASLALVICLAIAAAVGVLLLERFAAKLSRKGLDQLSA